MSIRRVRRRNVPARLLMTVPHQREYVNPFYLEKVCGLESYRRDTFCLDEAARGAYNFMVVHTRRSDSARPPAAGSWRQIGEKTMKVIVSESYEQSCALAADMIEKLVREKPECTLGLATGSSPVGMYKELARRCREEGLDFSHVKSVNLDEYVGLEPTHDQSYRYFMDSNLFDHINIDKANTYVAKGTGDVEANIAEFNAVLKNSDVDLQVLGVGPDGHLGFNEPGETLYDCAHKEVLDESTIDANARFFATRDDVPRYAVTMGMGDIMRAKSLLLIISGNKQEAATALLMDDKITTHCPATFMKLHRDATVFIEKKLADEIGYKG